MPNEIDEANSHPPRREARVGFRTPQFHLGLALPVAVAQLFRRLTCQALLSEIPPGAKRIARTRTPQFVCYLALLFAAQFPAAAQNGFSDAEADAIQAFLRENFGNTNAGMVIGLVDERGSRVLAADKLDNGTRQEVNGDTVFEIGSATKTCATLLLVDIVERGEMKLDDPVAKFLPESAHSPASESGLSPGLVVQRIDDVS